MKKILLQIILLTSVTSCTYRPYNYYTDMQHQKMIADAYFKFRHDEKKFPSDLEEIAEEGYLPKDGYVYSGYENLSIFPKTMSYKNSDYKIFNGFEGDQNKIIGIKSRENPNTWEFRSEITNYVSDKRK